MIALDLITDEVPPLKPTEKAIKAIHWMDEFKVSHLPVVDKQELLGIISEPSLIDRNSPEELIGNCKEEFLKIFVFESLHIFEVIKIISQHQLSIIPVLSADEKYLGCITLTHLMNVVAKMSVVSDPGGVIVLEMNVNDYYLSQIARIVEENDAKILGVFVTSHIDTTKTEITIKINKSDLSAILQSFERFNYKVTKSYDQGGNGDVVKDRFDQFMKFLNI